MNYLTGEEVLQIHSDIIDETGGAHGIRDTSLFLSILEKPKIAFGGKDMYETIFDKAAVYYEGFARYHVFIDGNKRTGIVAAARFLFKNGYDLTANNKEIESFTLRVVEEKLDIIEIAAWLKQNTKKITN